MDNNKFINLKTFEISDTPGDYILVDKEIAEVIALLNLKGYETVASCAGHNEIRFSETFECSKEEFNNWNDKFGVRVVAESADKVFYKSELLGETIYILFKEEYNFPFLPEGFDYENKNLYKVLNFYEETERRKDEDIENELKNNWANLKKWAREIKER